MPRPPLPSHVLQELQAAGSSNAALELENARLTAENAALKAVIAKHDLCHDLHGKVGRAEFEEGCRRETIKEYGSCGWAEEIERLNQMLRDTGTGQGSIDAYVAQCEEVERLRAALKKADTYIEHAPACRQYGRLDIPCTCGFVEADDQISAALNPKETP